MRVLGLDIGGSSVKHAVVAVEGSSASIDGAAASSTLATNVFADLKKIVTDIVATALSSNPKITAIGISTTGSVDREGTVVSAGHFEGYKDVSWSHLLRAQFRQVERVVTVNDGRASAWSEYSQESDSVHSHIHAVVGTGVGGGIVYEGDLLLGDSGQAGYIGHIKIATDSSVRCSCGSIGCVETLASGPAVARHYAALGYDEQPKSFDAVVAAASGGEERAVQALELAGKWLGLGLGNTMNVLNPSLVSVGGGVVVASESVRKSGDGGPYLDGVRAGILIAAHRRVAAIARLRPAHLGNDGGLLGASLLTQT